MARVTRTSWSLPRCTTPAWSSGRARWCARTLARRGYPGIAIAVAVGGETVWSEGFGYADLEHRVPMSPAVKFRVGSISKSMTAAAVATLVEAGRLDLDAPVQRYVPSFPEKAHPVTTRQLGGHLAGIRHYQGDENLIRDPYPTVLDGLAIFADDPLLHEPGTAFAYTSHGFNLISAVVAGAAGRPFLDYMREAVFRPLGMRDTVADFVTRSSPRTSATTAPSATRIRTSTKAGSILRPASSVPAAMACLPSSAPRSAVRTCPSWVSQATAPLASR